MRYALWFALSVVGLTTATLVTFDRISVLGLTAERVDSLALPTADTLPTRRVFTPVAPSVADYARYAASDAAWRAQHARLYTLAELRARGDGKRTPRDSVEDRVFAFMRNNQRPRAIAELERWISANPRDQGMLLSLARLLGEDGRSEEAIRRYRQILSLQR